MNQYALRTLKRIIQIFIKDNYSPSHGRRRQGRQRMISVTTCSALPDGDSETSTGQNGRILCPPAVQPTDDEK